MRASIRQAGILLLLACAPALATGIFVHWNGRQDALGPGEMVLAEAIRQRPPVLWVDARSSGEFAKEHLPQALPLNEDHWSDLLPTVLEKWTTGRTVVVYCNSKTCDASAQVAQRLREFKLGPVYILHGGWEAWQKTDAPR